MHPWMWVTRLGEAGLALPIFVLTCLAMGRSCGFSAAARCFVALLASLFLVAATKVAFLGFGWGIAAIDFTGASGHATLAAATYPLLAFVFLVRFRTKALWAAVAAMVALASLVAISRVVIGAHSVSEVAAGLLLGGGVGLTSIRIAGEGMPARPQKWWALPVVTWLVLCLSNPPMADTNGLVRAVSLQLSHRAEPFDRAQLHRSPDRPAALNGLRVGP